MMETGDLKLCEDVLLELAWEPRVDAAHITVTARDGVVTLAGHVGSYAEKRVAEQAARYVHGVRAIAEEIEVRLPEAGCIPDDQLAASAARMLEWDEAAPHERIAVTVDNLMPSAEAIKRALGRHAIDTSGIVVNVTGGELVEAVSQPA